MKKFLCILAALMMTSAVYGANMFWQHRVLVEEALAFHCETGDVDACHEAIRFYEANVEGLPRR